VLIISSACRIGVVEVDGKNVPAELKIIAL
jgi:hypothetical protein